MDPSPIKIDPSTINFLHTQPLWPRVDGLLVGTLNFDDKGKRICFYIRFSPDRTILSMKEDIEKNNGISVDSQILLYDGEKLDDDKSLSEYNIHENSVLWWVSIASRVDEPAG